VDGTPIEGPDLAAPESEETLVSSDAGAEAARRGLRAPPRPLEAEPRRKHQREEEEMSARRSRRRRD